MSKKAKILTVAGFIVLVAAVLLAYFVFFPKANDNSGGIEIQATVVHGDGSEKVFTLHTNAENLRQALEEIDLIQGEEGPYGIFIQTVDGETVDTAKEEWWNITRSGEMLMTGAEDTMIADGDCYEITFTVGYDFG